MTTPFTYDSIPDQTGRVTIVTGANTGIGYETALALARKGAHVTLACRNLEKATAAKGRIDAAVAADKGTGSVATAALDLSDLASVKRFTEGFAAAHQRLDLLVNNAGVMVPPKSRTSQGFELQFGTNHLGHFALTAQLLPLLRRAPGARVVVVSSGVHHFGAIAFDDLDFEKRGYSAMRAYAQSKLANLSFALELQRRLEAAGEGRGDKLLVTAAHPGWTATDLQRTAGFARVMNPLFAMRPADGALPTLRAATDPEAQGGSYYGPKNFFELSGPPVLAAIDKKARDGAVAARLWTVSEQLTGASFGLPAAAAAA